VRDGGEEDFGMSHARRRYGLVFLLLLGVEIVIAAA
jgi:hypothetical protein